MQGVESQLFASLNEALSSSIPRDLVNYRTLEATVDAMKSLDEEAKKHLSQSILVLHWMKIKIIIVDRWCISRIHSLSCQSKRCDAVCFFSRYTPSSLITESL